MIQLALFLLLLLPDWANAQAWSGAEQATIEALQWLHIDFWVGAGMFTAYLFYSGLRG